MKTVKRLAIGSSIAAAAGYAAGVLTAPKSGKQTRDDILQAATKNLAAAEKDLKHLHTELGKVMEDTKASGKKLGQKRQGDLESILESAQDAKEKARELISIIHEGGAANDKDLKKAIKDANAAIQHLRDFLRK